MNFQICVLDIMIDLLSLFWDLLLPLSLGLKSKTSLKPLDMIGLLISFKKIKFFVHAKATLHGKTITRELCFVWFPIRNFPFWGLKAIKFMIFRKTLKKISHKTNLKFVSLQKRADLTRF